MLNFTVGPVQSFAETCDIGGEQIPYFRTSEFSEIMFENECLMKEFVNAEPEGRVAFMTGSGTASMETVVMNVLSPKDKALIINGGSFGQRFVSLCELHHVPYQEVKLAFGEKLTESHLAPFADSGFTALLVNIHETSTGMYYDAKMLSKFCHDNNLLFVVDAISSFLADPFDMKALGVNVMITGSQKALACPPGVSIIVLDGKALRRVDENTSPCMYLDLKNALKNGERGQTPFTPAVGILIQIHARLKSIKVAGGVTSEIGRIHALAEDFRGRIKGLPLEIASPSLSNAVTPLHPTTMSAKDIFLELKDKYGIWVCPNGGDLADKIFRVGHLGALRPEDNAILVEALKKVLK